MRSSPRPSETETFQHFTHTNRMRWFIKAESRKRLYKLHGLKIVSLMESWKFGTAWNRCLLPACCFRQTEAMFLSGFHGIASWEHTLKCLTWWHGCWWFLNKRGYPLGVLTIMCDTLCPKYPDFRCFWWEADHFWFTVAGPEDDLLGCYRPNGLWIDVQQCTRECCCCNSSLSPCGHLF